MNVKTQKMLWVIGLVMFLTVGQSCQSKKESSETSISQKALSFDSRKIIEDAKFFWAHTPVDITGDSIADLVFINNNAKGGYLGYYKGQVEEGLWKKYIIAEAPSTGGLFAGGDLECADIDGDGDIDVLGIKHPGEWQDANAEAELFWYENPSWKEHKMGKVPDAVKDVSFTDFNKDGKMDMSILTFEESTLSVFEQKDSDEWERVLFLKNYGNLHEGMAVGDVNGDGYEDIVENAHLFYNPKGNLMQEWPTENIDAKWNSQANKETAPGRGDTWSRNGTKVFMRDIDGDNIVEIFMGHSERAGYPFVLYKKTDNGWTENVIVDTLTAVHTIQSFDFDLDGDYDVLAGINGGRAANLGLKEFDVSIYLSEGNGKWTKMLLNKEGIYNGQALDFEGDGDVDIFRYPNHESKDLFLLENKIK